VYGKVGANRIQMVLAACVARVRRSRVERDNNVAMLD
jgi:hypothetical protein